MFAVITRTVLGWQHNHHGVVGLAASIEVMGCLGYTRHSILVYVDPGERVKGNTPRSLTIEVSFRQAFAQCLTHSNTISLAYRSRSRADSSLSEALDEGVPTLCTCRQTPHGRTLTGGGDADRRSDLLAQDVCGGVDFAHVSEDAWPEPKTVVSRPGPITARRHHQLSGSTHELVAERTNSNRRMFNACNFSRMHVLVAERIKQAVGCKL